MIKRKKRVIGLVLSVVMSLSIVPWTACGEKKPDDNSVVGITESVDSARTQLYVSNYNGGYGSAWLEAAKKRFEDVYKDQSFEEGKTGVQVLIDNNKDSGLSIAATMQKSRNEIYFCQQVSYYEAISKNLLYDLTDVVTQSLSDYGEDKTIESKMTDQQKEYLKVNGSYYGIPHYATFYGITYDIDLFNQKKLFMGTDGNFGKKNSDSDLSSGVDGIPGTYDDGLPATYDEFYKLCSTMRVKGIIPVSWSGEYQFYSQAILSQLQVDHLGNDEAKILYSFNGTCDHIVDSVSSDGSVTLKSVNINNNNAYELFTNDGVWYGVNFMHELVKNDWIYDMSFNIVQSHTDAQDDYLLSNVDAEYTPIGMLFEGIWWNNEATSTFAAMEKYYGEEYSQNNRNFGLMPLPKATPQEIGTGTTLLDELDSYMYINANISPAKIELAKKFIAFCNTDVSIYEFAEKTNTPKALKHTLPAESYNKLTTYGKSIFDLYTAPTTNLIANISTNSLFYNNITRLEMEYRWQWGSYSFVGKTFHDNPDMTAKAYFDGIVNKYSKNYWESTYSEYFIN